MPGNGEGEEGKGPIDLQRIRTARDTKEKEKIAIQLAATHARHLENLTNQKAKDTFLQAVEYLNRRGKIIRRDLVDAYSSERGFLVAKQVSGGTTIGVTGHPRAGTSGELASLYGESAYMSVERAQITAALRYYLKAYLPSGIPLPAIGEFTSGDIYFSWPNVTK